MAFATSGDDYTNPEQNLSFGVSGGSYPSYFNALLQEERDEWNWKLYHDGVDVQHNLLRAATGCGRAELRVGSFSSF